MLGTYYYHEILRKTVIAFGTLFNDIHIRHKDQAGKEISDMKVALAYGPMQKFLARIEQQPELNKAIQITLPRMSFEMTNITYDATRKAGITQTFKAADNNNKLRKVFMPVPYNVGFELNVLVKLNDDGLQIIEQILPYFQPSFNITVNLVKSIGEKRDIPIVLDNISFRDEYEGDFTTRTALIYTLQFTAKTYLFGPVADTSDGLIKKVQVDYSTSLPPGKRQVRYVATPKALKDYNNDQTTTLTEDLTLTETRISINNSSQLSVGSRIVVNSEIMKVNSIEDVNTIVVKRGFDSSIASQHISGSTINLLTTADDALIEPGDDFGFNEFNDFFEDSKSWSPTKQSDI